MCFVHKVNSVFFFFTAGTNFFIVDLNTKSYSVKGTDSAVLVHFINLSSNTVFSITAALVFGEYSLYPVEVKCVLLSWTSFQYVLNKAYGENQLIRLFCCKLGTDPGTGWVMMDLSMMRQGVMGLI